MSWAQPASERFHNVQTVEEKKWPLVTGYHHIYQVLVGSDDDGEDDDVDDDC